MIFISQSGLIDRSRDAEWDRWYIEHLRAMATVPGIFSAQRFRIDTPGSPPSLAMYSVAAPEVFDDPTYLSVRGFREWQPQIDRQHYRRNLFAGLEQAPQVEEGDVLLVADREQPEDAIGGTVFTWLRSVGLDRSTPCRGLAVLANSQAPADPGVAVYRPVSPRFGGAS
ncbi:MAG: hypothetical protein OXG37_10495 [Actinomycetia bacterium]|nr:hypothetical protein [Actinomycetes bacterium]